MTLREAFDRKPNNLDALRLFFALLVLVAHSWPLAYGDPVPGQPLKSYEPVLWMTRGRLFGGTAAVLFFFLISGFLVSESLRRSGSAREYLRRRALRIYPAYVVAMLVCAFVVGPLFATRPERWLAEFPYVAFFGRLALLHMCVTPETLAHNPYPFQLNGSLWTIAHEFWCYLLVLGLGVAGLLRGRRALWVLVWALFAASYALWNLQVLYRFDFVPAVRLGVFGKAHGWPQLLTFFLAGVLMHGYARWIPLTGRLFAACCIVLVASAATRLVSLAVPIAGSYAVFYLAFADLPKLRALTQRGDLSYGVYLYAWPIQQSLLALGPATFREAPWVLAVAAMPPTLALAWLSWHFVEAPFLRRRARRAGAMPPPEVACPSLTPTGASGPRPDRR